MAATIAQVSGGQSGGVAGVGSPANSSHTYVTTIDVTGDTSYPAGGYTVTLSTFLPVGARVIEVLPRPRTGNWIPRWDDANSKLMLLSIGAAPTAALPPVDTTATTNVSTSVTRLIVIWEA